MFHNADPVVQVVLVGLLGASVVTWTVLVAKGLSFLAARRSVRLALGVAENQQSLAGLQGEGAGSVEAAMVRAAAQEMQLSAGHDGAGIKERVASRLRRLELSAGRQMARGTGLLATIGATAPFVGLFGTVWGIMNSFIGISNTQTTNLAVVAPGIAEALLATATGLVAAIPAVVIYNLFARGIGGYRAMLADYSAMILLWFHANWTSRPRKRWRRNKMAMHLGSGDEDDLAETHEINVTPFIDVMLVLLIIFMVAAPLATVDMPVDLPNASAQRAPRPEKPIYLTLKADDSLALDDTPVTQVHLQAALDAASGGDKSQRIFLRGDKTVPYGEMMQTLDALRGAGYLKVALVGLAAPAAP